MAHTRKRIEDIFLFEKIKSLSSGRSFLLFHTLMFLETLENPDFDEELLKFYAKKKTITRVFD